MKILAYEPMRLDDFWGARACRPARTAKRPRRHQRVARQAGRFLPAADCYSQHRGQIIRLEYADSRDVVYETFLKVLHERKIQNP